MEDQRVTRHSSAFARRWLRQIVGYKLVACSRRRSGRAHTREPFSARRARPCSKGGTPRLNKAKKAPAGHQHSAGNGGTRDRVLPGDRLGREPKSGSDSDAGLTRDLKASASGERHIIPLREGSSPEGPRQTVPLLRGNRLARRTTVSRARSVRSTRPYLTSWRYHVWKVDWLSVF